MRITDLIGKTLYPRQQIWERRRNVKLLGVVLFITFSVIAVFGLFIILKGFIHIDTEALLQ